MISFYKSIIINTNIDGNKQVNNFYTKLTNTFQIENLKNNNFVYLLLPVNWLTLK